MAQAAPVAQPAVELTYEVAEQVTLLTDAWRISGGQRRVPGPLCNLPTS